MQTCAVALSERISILQEAKIAAETDFRYQKEQQRMLLSLYVADPTTPSSELDRLHRDFPFEVAANPNASPETLHRLCSRWVSNAMNQSDDDDNEAPKQSIAMFWTLLNNPAIDMIRLEDPGHRLLEALDYSHQTVRMIYAEGRLSDQQRGRVFLAAFVPWNDVLRKRASLRMAWKIERVLALIHEQIEANIWATPDEIEKHLAFLDCSTGRGSTALIGEWITIKHALAEALGGMYSAGRSVLRQNSNFFVKGNQRLLQLRLLEEAVTEF